MFPRRLVVCSVVDAVPSVLFSFTPGEVLEGVPEHGVATSPEGHTHSVLAALDEVVGESDVETL